MTNSFKNIQIKTSFTNIDDPNHLTKIKPNLEDFQNPYKVFHHLDRVESLKKTGDSFPLHLTIGLTNHCNHKCSWCYINWNQAGSLAKRSGASNLNTKKAINADFKIIEAVKQAVNMGLKAVTIVGDGEPTLHPKFSEYLDELGFMKIDIGIFTNLSTRNESILDSMIKNCFFIRCSIDAASSEVHAIQHGTNDFEQIIENLKRIISCKKDNKPIIGVQYVVNEKNIHELEEAVLFYKKIGVDYITIKPAYKNLLNIAHESNKLNLDDALLVLKKVKQYQDNNYKVYSKESQFIESLSFETNSARYYKKCYATPLSPYLDEDGSLEMCGNLKGRGFNIGNINDSTFKELWESERRQECMSSIDLFKCPSGCKLDPINKVLWDAFNPEKNILHPNFV